MDRIIGANTIDLGGGRRGFRGKDTVAGIPGTELAAVWHNAIQEEIVGLIEACGGNPSNADFTQLLQAIRSQVLNYVEVGGSPNALTADLERNLARYVKGLPLRLKIAATNSGPMTLDVDGIGAVSLLKRDGTAMQPGDAVAGQILTFVFGPANAFYCTSPVASDVSGLRGRAIFTASGTLTILAGCTVLKLMSWGGAGGGGGINASGGAGGGGGGGEYREGLFTVVPAATHAVSIGTGGNGGTIAGTNGSNGGSTSVGSLMTAAGGLFGAGASGTYGQGGAGGSGGSGGSFSQNGGNGSNGGNLGSVASCGTGGGSWKVPNHYLQFSAGAGGNGLFYGQGGNGATGGIGAAAGGNGKSGLVIAEFY
ncbi:hypothetical protein [Bosea sp. TND4EK4]|uniref:glycine-rich domain-containing protein n=1 Tax=Bosea sp. TND4EK4 TaxID=1907408 RepID=UPI0009545838|nr:hypothetical protein [Bosea sp. TND4EK4]SIP96453.1 hypothetical protein SAMN05880592_101354 [Bosea sp. TND4EK4]